MKATALLALLLAVDSTAQARLYDRTCIAARRSTRGGVMCSTGEPCPRTNTIHRTEEFDDAVWTKAAAGAAAVPVVTANATTGPTGTSTADRVQIPATTTLQDSYVAQFLGCSAGANSLSVYVKGVSGSGGTNLCTATDVAGNVIVCVSCPFTSSAWSRCQYPNVTTTSASPYYIVGNMSKETAVALSASDVYLWGAQCELGATVSGYIGPVLDAPVTRTCP